MRYPSPTHAGHGWGTPAEDLRASPWRVPGLLECGPGQSLSFHALQFQPGIQRLVLEETLGIIKLPLLQRALEIWDAEKTQPGPDQDS